jgi:hypothetical protein
VVEGGSCQPPPQGAPDGPSPASSRQLSYLRRLADQTGHTFTYPKTSREASAEIDRLKTTPRQSRSERDVERELSADYA